MTKRRSTPEEASGTGRRAAPASLATLAAHLRLSPAAISRVLNGVPAAKSIPQVTQERIFAAAKQFSYRPNALARSLRRGQSHTVGVLVPEVSEGYATLVLSGIEQRLMQEEYLYFVVSHHHRPELIERYQQTMMARGVDGMIAVDTPLAHRPALPTVTVSGHHEPAGVTNILLDHRRAATLALQHLHGLGHRRIAFIKGQSFSSDTRVRWRAIQLAAAQLGLEIDPRLTAQLLGDAPTHEPGLVATQQLLAAGREFTALFAFNDMSAIGAVRALREAGRRVPADVSVVGFDDVQAAAYQNPPLTTVRQPLVEMGRLAAQAVLQQMLPDYAGDPLADVVVEPELMVRQSSGRARTGARTARPAKD